MGDNKNKTERTKTDLFFLVRELRFAVNLIHLALEETNHFDLVINDQSFFTFMLLSSQGVERLLKLSLSYSTIIEERVDDFSPKKFGHSISKLYKNLKSNVASDVQTLYKELFDSNSHVSLLLNKFTDLLEVFNKSGRYYYTSSETREKERYEYYFDEHFVYLINEYENIKCYNKNFKNKKYKEELRYAIETAKMIDGEYEKLVPDIFCESIDKRPLIPFWEDNMVGNKQRATESFKMASREFLLMYISPVVLMLEKQFISIMDKYNIPYHFDELTKTIRNQPHNYKKKRHRMVVRDVYSSLLL